MEWKVPFVDPKQHYRKLKADIDAAISDCLTRGDLICRHHLEDFEAHFAAFVGVKYAVGLNSGYHALEFSLRAAGIGPGAEVIVPAHTFVAAVSAIVNCGAQPVLVDVQEDFNLDSAAFEAAITPRTKAVIPVHLNGRVCEMDRIMKVSGRHGLAVVEDACQSLGASHKGRRAGSIGLTGCWSFYPFKLLGGFGDGGAITTDDPRIARTVTLLRYNGEDRKTGEYHCHGQTALLDNVQAAVLDAKLRHVTDWISHRRKIAELYCAGLEGVTGLKLPHFSPADHFDVFQNYVVRTSRRDRLRDHLTREGVETLVSWPKPMWHHKGLGLGDLHLPETESICREVLSLPMSAETTPDHVNITVRAVRDFFANENPVRKETQTD